MINLTVVGQGYVGLPLAIEAALSELKVTGFEANEAIAHSLNRGHSHVDDISDEKLLQAIELGYSAATDPEIFSSSEVIVICVPTPLGENKVPDLRYVEVAARTIAANVSPGTLVVLESTTYPGTTRDVVAPILQAEGFTIGEDLFLAFSPERIDPGNPVFNLRNTPKVVGADDSQSLQKAIDFYSRIVDHVVPVSGTGEAELTKLLENTYRHINIALVNEMAMFSRDLGINIWEVIEAASTKPFGFQAFYPGPGVGGHCIPIDPNYLNYRVKNSLGRPFRFVDLAEEINTSMPAYLVSRIQDILNGVKKPLHGSKVLLLGVTYKGGISDTRESPALPILELLSQKGATVEFHDPFVEVWKPNSEQVIARVGDLKDAIVEADITILLQNHPVYDLNFLEAESKLFLNSRGAGKPSYSHGL